MTDALVFPNLAEPDVERLAQDLAFVLAAGDALALSGDLGSGKTTFARAFIRAATGDHDIQAPSPTFTLAQTYDAPRCRVTHYDFYRLQSPDELDELGLEAALAEGIALIEWPERAGKRLQCGWRLRLDETDDAYRRCATLSAAPGLRTRLNRYGEIRAFLKIVGWGGADARLSYLQGDASARKYARLHGAGGHRAILMDSPAAGDGPPIRDGRPYSRIAHLAEDVRAFVAIANALRDRGFSAPEILAHDLDCGLLVIEDFGDAVFVADAARRGVDVNLWARAVDALIALRAAPPPPSLPLPGGASYALPALDAGVLEIETALLIDWYWPALFGEPAAQSVRQAYETAWATALNAALTDISSWMLRDYHSPNLIALQSRAAPMDVGIIDFQDALRGPAAFDLVSLLQDARVTVAPEIAAELLERYIANVRAREPAFDEEQFRFEYAALGAQRNTKILGIFARLAKRDGKRQYLAHLPRIWGYLARDLAHPRLKPVRAWYDAHIPAAARQRALDI